MAWHDLDLGRVLDPAPIEGDRAAGVEATSRRDPGCVGGLAAQDLPLRAGAPDRATA